MNDYNNTDFNIICSCIVKKSKCQPVNNEFSYWTINGIQFHLIQFKANVTFDKFNFV